MGLKSTHIILLVIYSLRANTHTYTHARIQTHRDTHTLTNTHTDTHAHTDTRIPTIHTESILKNQACS